METINIAGIEKPVLLAGLYNASQQLGLGFLHERGQTEMTPEQASTEIEQQGLSFDYLHGRVMKINLEGDEMRFALFDRDNGNGAAKRVVDSLRETEAS